MGCSLRWLSVKGNRRSEMKITRELLKEVDYYLCDHQRDAAIKLFENSLDAGGVEVTRSVIRRCYRKRIDIGRVAIVHVWMLSDKQLISNEVQSSCTKALHKRWRTNNGEFADIDTYTKAVFKAFEILENASQGEPV